MMNPETRVRCFACGDRTDPAADSCSVCGVAQVRLCASCSGPLSVYGTTCPGCGRDHRPRRYRPPLRWLTIAVPLAILVLVGVAAIFLVPSESDLDAARRALTPGSRDRGEARVRLAAAAEDPDTRLRALMLTAELAMREIREGSSLDVIRARGKLAAVRAETESLVAERGETPELSLLLARCAFAAGDDEGTVLRLRRFSSSDRGLAEEARLLLARAHWRRGDRSTAVSILTDLAETASDPRTLAHAVEVADRRGDAELGHRILTRAKSRFPGSPIPGGIEAYRALGLEIGDPPPAAEVFEAMHRKDPEDPLPLLLLADLARRAGDRTREIDALSKAIHLRPGLPRIRLARADAYLRCGFPAAAIDDATEAVRHGAPPADAAPILARANLAGPSPDPTLALVALANAPPDPALLPLRIRTLALLDRPEQAVAVTRRAMGRLTGSDLRVSVATELVGIPTPDATALAGKLVGKVLAEDSKHGRARFLRALLADRWEDIEALLTDDPGNAPARRYLFERYMEKDPKRARALAAGALDRTTTRYLEGRLYLVDGDPEAAAEAFRAVLADEPRDREAVEGLSAALEAAGPTAADRKLEARLREAEADVRAERYAGLLSKIRRWRAEAIDAGPVGRPSEVVSKILYQGAVAAEELRNLERAKDLYRASIRQRPDHYAALNNLALLLAVEPGTAVQAVWLAGRAARLAPGVAEILDTLGTARLAVDDADGAVAAYRKAVALFLERGKAGNRSRARSLVRLARACRESYRAEDAQEALLQAAAADPEVRESADWPQADQNR